MSASPLTQAPVLPFSPAQERKAAPETIASDHSLLEIDRELDALFDQMQDELEEKASPARKASPASTPSATPMARRSTASAGSSA